MKFGFLFQKGGIWIGVHYSEYNKRYCINLIPCFTIWVCKPGGKAPDKAMPIINQRRFA